MEDNETMKKGEDSLERERKFEFEFTSNYVPTKGKLRSTEEIILNKIVNIGTTFLKTL